MSISRKNWSALSSLARQWTVEDEEEVEREKRRRVKSSSSGGADPQSPGDTPTGGGPAPSGTDGARETSPGLSSVEQIQLDFVEMLRVRDEKRRMRHVEALRRQEEEEDEGQETRGGGGEARVELLGDLNEEQGEVFAPVTTTTRPQPQPKAISSSSSLNNSSSSSSSGADVTSRRENDDSQRKESDPGPASNRTRKFVSSVSISLDKSPSTSGQTTPMSPRSPTPPASPRQHGPPSCQSPAPQGPVQNGHTEQSDRKCTLTNGSCDETNKPALVRQSSRTISFRMMRKKEEERSPLQRSASVRAATKKFESNTDQNEDEDKPLSFLRNSRQRISSRSIQEKMERLAQAAQKSEVARPPDVTQRTLFLMDEVSRKRGLFERDEQREAAATSPGTSRQEFRSFTSGMSHRINRLLNRTNQSAASHSPTDLRHVDISSKKSVFESRGEESASHSSSVKSYK